MEPDLTYNEFMVEDGHVKPDEDMVIDDLDRLYNLKHDFIELMQNVKKIIPPSDFNEYAICIEEYFEDMLHGEKSRLIEIYNHESQMPRSQEYQNWLAEEKRKTLSSEPIPAHNPATLQALGRLS